MSVAKWTPPYLGDISKDIQMSLGLRTGLEIAISMSESESDYDYDYDEHSHLE